MGAFKQKGPRSVGARTVPNLINWGAEVNDGRQGGVAGRMPVSQTKEWRMRRITSQLVPAIRGHKQANNPL